MLARQEKQGLLEKWLAMSNTHREAIKCAGLPANGSANSKPKTGRRD